MHGESPRHDLQHVAHDLGDVNWQAPRLECGEQMPKLRCGGIAHNRRCMATLPADGRADETPLLLGNLDGIEASAADPLGEATNLAEGESDALEEAAMLLDEVLRAELAPGLLVAGQREQEIARRLE